LRLRLRSRSMAAAMAAGAAGPTAVAAVEDSTGVVAADFTEAVAPAAVAVSTVAAVSAAARAVDARLAADDQGRLVFAAAHPAARVEWLRVRAVRLETAGRAPTASME